MSIDIIDCCFSYSPGVRKVCWLLTMKCNLNCIHCSVSSSYASQPSPAPTDLLRVAKQLLNHGITDVILSGGEPTLIGDLPAVIACLRSLGFRVSLVTNATLLDREYVAKLVQHGLRKVTVGLDGATEATHDTFRGVAGAFERAVHGTRVLIDSGIQVTVNTTLHNANLRELADILRLLTKLRVYGVSFVFPMNCGRTAANSTSFTMVSQKRESVLSQIQRTATLLQPPYRVRVLRPRCDADTCPSGASVFGFDDVNGLGNCLFRAQDSGDEIPSQRTVMALDLHEGHMISSRRECA